MPGTTRDLKNEEDFPRLTNPVGDEVIPAMTAAGAPVGIPSSALFADGGVSADHILSQENPHSVTKEQVGLGSVDNTSDADKPVSTAQQVALDVVLGDVAGFKTEAFGAVAGARDGHIFYDTEYAFCLFSSNGEIMISYSVDSLFEMPNNLALYPLNVDDPITMGESTFVFVARDDSDNLLFGSTEDGNFSVPGIDLWGGNIAIRDQESNLALQMEHDGSVTANFSKTTLDWLCEDLFVWDGTLNAPGECSGLVRLSKSLIRYFCYDGQKPMHVRQRTDIETNTAIQELHGKTLYIPILGESLPAGGRNDEDNPDVVTPTPLEERRCFMVSRMMGANKHVLNTTAMVDLVPAHEQAFSKLDTSEFDTGYKNNTGETPGTRLAYTLDKLLDHGQKRTIVVHNSAASGTKTSQFKKGTQFFGQIVAGKRKSQEVAAAYGLDMEVRAFYHHSGVNDGNEGLTKAVVAAEILAVSQDLQEAFADMKPADLAYMPSIMIQTNGSSHGQEPGGACEAQAELQFSDPEKIIIAAPQYHMPMAPGDNGHPSAISQARTGEYLAKAFRDFIVDGVVIPTRVSENGVTRTGRVFVIDLDVTVGNIVEDTTTLPAAPNKGWNVIPNATGLFAAIESVVVTGPKQITLTCVSDPGPSELSYAMYPGSAPEDYSDCWGNYRDEETLVSEALPGAINHNWLLHYKEEIA